MCVSVWVYYIGPITHLWVFSGRVMNEGILTKESKLNWLHMVDWCASMNENKIRPKLREIMMDKEYRDELFDG